MAEEVKQFRSQLFRLLWPQRPLLAALFAAALLTVLTEGVGLGLVLLVLDAGGGGTAIVEHGWLGSLARRVQSLSVGTHIRMAAGALLAVAIVRSGLQYGQHLL